MTLEQKDDATIVAQTAAFKEDFKALLKKYQCEMSVATSYRNYETYVDGVEFNFDGIYAGDCEIIRPYFSINIGTFASCDCV